MTERPQQPHRAGKGTTRSEPPPSPAIEALRDQTIPLPAVPAAGEAEPTILGFPAEPAQDGEVMRPAAEPASDVSGHGGDVLGDTDPGRRLAAAEPESAGAPGSAVQLVVLRRAERFGGLALVLAGIAAGVSLWLPWRRGDGATGLSLVRRGIAGFGSGLGEIGRNGLWQPLAVVLGGGVLFLLGLVLFRRARTHRLVGVLALLVAVAAAAGVVVPLADADWRTAPFGLGMWFAVAVAGLGVLGAMKAMLTAPLVTTGPR